MINHTHTTDYGCDDCLWEYKPSKAAAMLFLVLWSITTLFHGYQMFRYHKWYLWVLLMGGAWEVGGALCRFLSALHPRTEGFYIPMQALEILAPIWIAAFDYMTIGRLIHFFIPSKKIMGIGARYVTRIFVLSDIVCFLVQMTGTSFLSGNDISASQMRTGTDILLGGLGIQLACFIFFTAVAVKFELDYKRQLGPMDPQTRWFVRALYISCGGVIVRSIYRLAEFAPPFPGPLWTHEAPFYTLDQLPLLPTLVVFNIWHPGMVLVGEESSLRAAERVRKVEKKEAKQQKKKEKRMKKKELP